MKFLLMLIPLYLFGDTLTIENFSAIDNIVLIASTLLVGIVGFWLIEKALKVIQ